MLSWIRNLHTCNRESCCWHGRVGLLLGPSPPHAQQEQPQGAVASFLGTARVTHWWAAPCGCAAVPWAGTVGVAPMGALECGTYRLCVGRDPDPLAGRGQLRCLLQDFREGQEVVEEQEPLTL